MSIVHGLDSKKKVLGVLGRIIGDKKYDQTKWVKKHVPDSRSLVNLNTGDEVQHYLSSCFYDR